MFVYRKGSLLRFCCLIFVKSYISPARGSMCRPSEFIQEKKDSYLRNHVNQTIQTETTPLCRIMCYLNHVCMSYNYHKGTGVCEINNSDNYQHPKDLVKKAGYVYVGTKNVCTTMPCSWKDVCQTNVKSKEYNCVRTGPCEICRKEALGMENGSIPDYQITASSMWDQDHSPSRARLHLRKQGDARGAWVPSFLEYLKGAWLKVNLGKLMCIVGSASQGREDYPQWVTMYSLQSSLDDVLYNKITIFNGNRDQNTVVEHKINPAVSARYVKIIAINWAMYGIAMRLELYGCDL